MPRSHVVADHQIIDADASEHQAFRFPFVLEVPKLFALTHLYQLWYGFEPPPLPLKAQLVVDLGCHMDLGRPSALGCDFRFGKIYFP